MQNKMQERRLPMSTSQLQRIDRAMTSLVLDQPFFAVLAMKLNVTENDSVPTFSTNGRDLLVNPKFCATLKDNEIITVITHEVLHCALGHVWRMQEGGDTKRWNIACDNEVNWELEESNITAKQKSAVPPFPWPKCGKEMQNKFKGWAAEKVYRALGEDPEQQQGTGNGNGQGNGQEAGFGEIIPAPKDDKLLKEEWERAVVQAVKSTKGKGTIPNGIHELVERITSNKVDWRSLLRDHLYTIAKEDWNFSKSNQRYATTTEFMMPSLFNEKAGHIVFAIDTSGSIDYDMLKEFLNEAQIALDDLSPEKLTILQCDTQIHKVSEYEPGDQIDLKVYGRGGTDFRPVFEWCKKQDEQPRVLVYLTDLDGQFPREAPEYPVIWVSSTKAGVPFGDAVITK